MSAICALLGNEAAIFTCIGLIPLLVFAVVGSAYWVAEYQQRARWLLRRKLQSAHTASRKDYCEALKCGAAVNATTCAPVYAPT